MKCLEVIRILEQQAAPKYACSWDNVGLLAGRREKEVKKVYIALDASDEAVDAAVDAGADMLLTHHPLIFGGIKRVTDDDFTGRRLMVLIRADISYYAMHTNFDVMGMAGLAAEKMKMTDTAPLEVTCTEDGVMQGIGKTGNLERAVTLLQCCEQVKAAFELDHVIVYGDLGKMVQRAAICPGSGKSDIGHALAAGADVYITGDIGHHEGMDADAAGMAVIDAGHYGLEHIFIPYMGQYLRAHAPELEVILQGRADPFQIV